MSSRRRFGREELAAVIVAGALALLAAGGWSRGRARSADCCGAERSRVEKPLPVDPLLHSGRLDNGLRYFVRANSSPSQRAELQLVVNVGSVVEEEDERGLAHAVEHMLFRGTRRFPRRTVQEYLESVGMRNGEDLNAHTGRDATTYELRVPTDRLGVLDTAMAMLADMASAATFDSAEARVEGGIVMAEWRSDRSTSDHVAERRDSIVLAGSRYASRPPIGDTAVIRRFDVQKMRRFYERWYRPDLMAVVAVGDFDPLLVTRLVKEHFGTIARPATPVTRPTIDVPRMPSVQSFALTDPEATSTELSLWIPRPTIRRASTASYRERAAVALWRAILEARLSEAAEEPDSPFLRIEAYANRGVRPLETDVITATVPDGRVQDAAARLVTEVNRLMHYGPSEQELRTQVEAMLRRREQAAQWAEDSEELVSSYAEEFLAGHLALTRSTSFEAANSVLPTLGVNDIKTAARRSALADGAILFTTSPVGTVAQRVSSEQLVQLVRRVTLPEEERRGGTSDTTVLTAVPRAVGSVRSERSLADVNAYDWTLSNGMRLILKPTRFSYDQFQFRLFAPGGASLADGADFASAFFADEVIRTTGIGTLTGRQLGRRLDQSSIDLSLNVNDSAVELRGTSAPDDLELLFQVLHLYFTAPRADTLAFRRWRDRRLAMAARRERDPDAAFADTLAAVTAQHHPSALRFGRAFIDRVDLSRALDFWRARTANASNFTLVLTGDFTLDRVRNLAVRYLASLPAGVSESPRDDGSRFPASVVRRTFRAGPGPKARTSIVLSGPYQLVEASAEALSLAGDVAELALNEQLRETLGATYDVDVSTSADLVPPLSYRMTIDFESDPALMDSLANVALREIERLRTSGPTEAEVAKIRAARTRDFDNSSDDNAYWADELAWHARPGFLPGTIKAHQENARALTAASIRAACAKYLDTARHVRVTMYPRRDRRRHQPELPSAGEGSARSGR